MKKVQECEKKERERKWKAIIKTDEMRGELCILLVCVLVLCICEDKNDSMRTFLLPIFTILIVG